MEQRTFLDYNELTYPLTSEFIERTHLIYKEAEKSRYIAHNFYIILIDPKREG